MLTCMDDKKAAKTPVLRADALDDDDLEEDEPEGEPVGESLHHEGTACPVCGLTTVCGHPVKYPPIPPWQANIWVKSIPTDHSG